MFATSACLKYAMTEFFTAEKVNFSDIYHHLQAVYGGETVDWSTVNRWLIKFHALRAGKVNIQDEPHILSVSRFPYLLLLFLVMIIYCLFRPSIIVRSDGDIKQP